MGFIIAKELHCSDKSAFDYAECRVVREIKCKKVGANEYNACMNTPNCTPYYECKVNCWAQAVDVYHQCISDNPCSWSGTCSENGKTTPPVEIPADMKISAIFHGIGVYGDVLPIFERKYIK